MGALGWLPVAWSPAAVPWILVGNAQHLMEREVGLPATFQLVNVFVPLAPRWRFQEPGPVKTGSGPNRLLARCDQRGGIRIDVRPAS